MHYAEQFNVDAVLCGHIHSASVRQIGRITYYNCGDWVESCTALVERYDGTIEIVKYAAFPASAATNARMKVCDPQGAMAFRPLRSHRHHGVVRRELRFRTLSGL